MSGKEYFDNVAKKWDEMRKDFFSESVREKAFEIAKVQNGEYAADIGAGSGFITEGLLRRGLKVICVDQSQAMLDVLKSKFGDAVETRIGGGETLPVRDATVDHVFANMYLHHVEDPAKAIAEMVRILKPGGKVVITDLDAHEFEFLRTEHHDRWMGFRRDDMLGWLKEAGLEKAGTECAGSDCCADSACGKSRAKVGIFAGFGQKKPLSKSALAGTIFKNSYNCSQAVFSALAPELGLDSDLAVRIGTSFGMGMTRAKTCGAVTGALMAIGLKYGGGGLDGQIAKNHTYSLVKEFCAEFEKVFKGIDCVEVIGIDLTVPENLKKAREDKLFDKICLNAVGVATDIAERILCERRR